MAKKRLSNKDRDILISLANKKVEAPAEFEAAVKKATAKYEKLQAEGSAMLKAKVEALFDPAEMTVLAKWGHTSACTRLRITLKKTAEDAAEKGLAGGFMVWDFDDRSTAPVVPSAGSFHDLPYDERGNRRGDLPSTNNFVVKGADETLLLKFKAAEEALRDAKDARESARRELMADYRGLINTAKTYEDVVEIWPEASEVRMQIVPDACTALVAFSAEAAERIKREFLARQKASERQAATAAAA